MDQMRRPTPDDVIAAAARLKGIVVKTPLVRSDELDRLTGAKVFVKLENLQHTGAFKFRGAYNTLSQLDRVEFSDGVIAYSTGNHGHAVSAIGKLLGIPVTVVVPSDAPANKIEKARLNGARIVLFDRTTEVREEVAARLASQGRYAVVPPGDHVDVIAGQGSVALEAFADLGADVIDAFVVSAGGGSLAAGTCLAAQAVGSNASVWAAEPDAFDDTRKSLLSGVREKNSLAATSICDALMTLMPAELPFSINQTGLAGVLTATDAEVRAAMRFAFENFRVVLEPAAVVGLAALLSGRESRFVGKTVVVFATGGNVDAALYADVISGRDFDAVV